MNFFIAGRMSTSTLLLDEKANPALMTRVQGSLADYFVGTFGFRPFGLSVPTNYRIRPLIKTLPPLLAPLLFDSPCCLNERNKSGHKNGPLKLSMLDKFSVSVFNRVVQAFIAPLVDNYAEMTENDLLEDALSDLIAIHTDYKHLIDDKVFPKHSLVSLLFGRLASGLRQTAIRSVLYAALFDKSINDLSMTMQELQGKVIQDLTAMTPSANKKQLLPQPKRKVERTYYNSDTNTSSREEVDLSKETLSEPEMSMSVRSSTPFPSRDSITEEDRLNRYDENWYLGESPRYGAGGQPVVALSQLEDSSELEISQEGRQTVTRLQRMLQETDDRLEKLQSEVGSLDLQQPNRAINNVSEESDDEDSDFEDGNSDDRIRRIWMPKIMPNDDESSSLEPRKKPSSTLFSLSPFGKLTPKVQMTDQPDPRFDEAVVRLLTPQVVESLRSKLGLPPGLRCYLELEVARLQLGASLFHHSTIKCDRGCEGNDEESEITTTDEDDDLSSTTSWDDSFSEPSSNENDEDSSLSEASSDSEEDTAAEENPDPSVPERPRILSSPSDNDDDSDNVPDPGFDGPIRRYPIADEAFFSFGANNEHQTIISYVQQMVQGTFDHSTDSETD